MTILVTMISISFMLHVPTLENIITITFDKRMSHIFHVSQGRLTSVQQRVIVYCWPSILVPDLIGFLSTLTFSVCFFCTFPFFLPTLLIAFLTHILIILIWLLHCWSGSVAPPLCKLFIFFHIFTFTKSIFFRTLSPP